MTSGDTAVFAPPYNDGFVAAFDMKGLPTRSRWIGTETPDRASAIAIDASGVYVAGATQRTLPGHTSAVDSDGFLRKYSVDGSEIWTRQFGASRSDELLALALDGSGVYLAGITEGTIAGQPIWTGQFGTPGYDDALGLAVNAQGVYCAGNTRGALPGPRST